MLRGSYGFHSFCFFVDRATTISCTVIFTTIYAHELWTFSVQSDVIWSTPPLANLFVSALWSKVAKTPALEILQCRCNLRFYRVWTVPQNDVLWERLTFKNKFHGESWRNVSSNFLCDTLRMNRTIFLPFRTLRSTDISKICNHTLLITERGHKSCRFDAKRGCLRRSNNNLNS